MPSSPCNKPHVHACSFFQEGKCKHGDGTQCKFAHVKVGPPAPAAPAPAAFNAGAGIIATHDYINHNDQPTCLAAFFIRERPWDSTSKRFLPGHVYSFPLEGCSGPAEAPEERAARALHEELHLRGLGAAELRNSTNFVHVKLPPYLHLFIAQQPGKVGHCGGESGTYSREHFRERLAVISSAKNSGAKMWEGVNIGAHLETSAFVHVNVESLLCTAGGGALAPRDHEGKPLDAPLRGVCEKALREDSVQAALQAAVANFRTRHPHLAASASGAAAPQHYPPSGGVQGGGKK